MLRVINAWPCDSKRRANVVFGLQLLCASPAAAALATSATWPWRMCGCMIESKRANSDERKWQLQSMWPTFSQSTSIRPNSTSALRRWDFVKKKVGLSSRLALTPEDQQGPEGFASVVHYAVMKCTHAYMLTKEER